MAITSYAEAVSLTRCQGQMALRARLCAADLDVPRSPVFIEVLYKCLLLLYQPAVCVLLI